MSAVTFGLFLTVFYGALINGVIGDAKNQMDNTGNGRDSRPSESCVPVAVGAHGW